MADRGQMLQEINEVSFAVNDVLLYLDTHPTDTEALEFFDQCMAKRKQALLQFEQEFYPLTVDCVTPEAHEASGPDTKYGGIKHFNWVDGPVPWEGGAL